jgi:hypothetical protein
MRRIPKAKILAICAWIAASAGAVSAQSWDQLYQARLQASSSYLEAKLALKTAELAYDQYAKPFIPTVAIATTTSSSLSIGSEGFSSGSLTPSITFENLLGADLAVKAPLVASSGSLGFGNPSVSLTRKLFVEMEADRLDALAAVTVARATVRNAENAVRIALATDILNANYYASLLEVDQKNLATLERVRKATVEPTYARELDKRILQARRSMLVAQAALKNVADDVGPNAAALNAEVLRMQEEWAKYADAGDPSDPADPADSLEIQGLKLSLEAAERRKAFGALPWLPNPSLTASLAYDVDAGTLEWGLSFSLSYKAFDKGQNSLTALRRAENPKILAIKLDTASRSRTDGIRKTRDALKLLELDRRIQDLEIADAEDAATLMQRLYDGGYASEDNLVIAQIDLEVERIAGRKIDFDILIQRLNLANYFSAEGAGAVRIK